jgi:hypothetical protein
MNPLIHPRKFYKVTVTTLSGIFATKRADPYILHDRRYTSMHLLFYERLVCTCHSKGVLVTGGITTLYNNSKMHQHKCIQALNYVLVVPTDRRL